MQQLVQQVPPPPPAGPFHDGASRQGLGETATGSSGGQREEAEMPFLSSGSSRLNLLIFCLKGPKKKKKIVSKNPNVLFSSKRKNKD